MAFVWATVLFTRVRSQGRAERGAIILRGYQQSRFVIASSLFPLTPGSSRPRKPQVKGRSERDKLEQDICKK